MCASLVKEIFDFLRNLLLCAAVLAASLFVEYQSQDGLGREIIFSDRFYEDRSHYLTQSYEEYITRVIESELELYFRGFQQGGVRNVKRMTKSEYALLQSSLQRLELLRFERYNESTWRRWLSNSLFLGAFFLAILNGIWIASKIQLPQHRFVTLAVKIPILFCCTAISGAVLITILEARRTEFFSSNISRNDIIEFAEEVLGNNEYQSFDKDHLYGISFDIIRW